MLNYLKISRGFISPLFVLLAAFIVAASFGGFLFLSQKAGLFESQAARICSSNQNTAQVCQGMPTGTRCNEPGKFCVKIGSDRGDYPNCQCGDISK